MDSTSSTDPISDIWIRTEFDHLSPKLGDRFYETLATMRSTCPVVRSNQHGGFWVLTRYEDVLQVAQDWRTFSSAEGVTIPRNPVAIKNFPEDVDPPEHRIYKRIINQYLTPPAVGKHEAATRRVASGTIDEFIERGECEFMDSFARPFPSQVFFQLTLGAPLGEIDQVAYMASKASSPHDPEAAECWVGLSRWIREFVVRRSKEPPRGDVVDGVLNSDVAGRPVTSEEAIGMLQILILGGLETTAGVLGQMMLRFIEHPRLRSLLRNSPDLIPIAIEEMLRLDTSFVAVACTATRDTEVGGHPVKKGEKILMYWASANRDEAEFSDPTDFNSRRRVNRHLAFGAGPHRCAGSSLARLNLRVALEELLPRLDDVALKDGARVSFHTTFTRSPHSLPITFTPGRRIDPVTARRHG